MSKIGKKPVNIPSGVTVEVKDGILEVKGPKATLTVPVLPNIAVEIKDDTVLFTAKNDTKQTISNWGTMRALAENAVIGSTEGYAKTLLVEGVEPAPYGVLLDDEDTLPVVCHAHTCGEP